MAVVGVAALAAVGAVAYSAGHDTAVTGNPSAASQPATGSGGAGGGSTGGGASGTLPDGSGGSSTSASTAATAAESVGVVDINTVLGYQGARAAGTGLVLTSTGEILTNNHVVDGATKISVTVVSTGTTYSATVVGTDPTDDVAVLQLSNASGLRTAAIGDSSTVRTGASVTGVGNAGGVGGTPSAAVGQVVALNQSLTASDTTGSNPENLTGMIEINAPIEAGDSGGPLYNSSGKIVGIDTAAQTNGRTTSVAYAIPINRALALAAQIESGPASSTIHLGYPPFMGIAVSDANGGALVEHVTSGSPAQNAGLAGGDVITAVDGTKVTSTAGLKSALSSHKPGDTVTIHWTDTAGQAHSASLTLITGPAD
ncbi:MAG: S1C family serine protease [Actinomycetota bacterium]|nr:S1C family serine protease [Actinomycetota bacterium]